MRLKQKTKLPMLFMAVTAMILSVLAQTTPLWAKQVNGKPLIICSAFGEKTIFINDDGKEIQQSQPSEHKKTNLCEMCFVHAFGKLKPTLITTQITFNETEQSFVKNDYLALTPKYTNHDHTIRAPPTHS